MSESIPKKYFSDYLKVHFTFHPQYLKKYLTKDLQILKNGKSSGPNSIPTNILKENETISIF